jgi:hypothetical protein
MNPAKYKTPARQLTGVLFGLLRCRNRDYLASFVLILGQKPVSGHEGVTVARIELRHGSYMSLFYFEKMNRFHLRK